MGIFTKIILGIIVLHLIIGFGWLIYKLSPRPNDKPWDDEEDSK